MKLALAFLLVVFAAPQVSVTVGQTRSKQLPRYSCPMHPEVTSTKRGKKCPKCGMALTRQSAQPKTDPQPEIADVLETSPSVKIPDTQVLDQYGTELTFSDLVKDKVVAINFVFTTCTAICPSLTATFRRVQQEAAARGLKVQLISISVDPTTDTPERLKDFAAKFKAEPGWTFVTGEKTRIDSVLQALGAAVSNRNDHTPMILIGNASSNYWTRAYGLTSPTKIVDILADAAKRK
ncbi:MAG TPA: SCO family protein [Pyrinomonadaceae bacterium]|nr:SCO family protein [Pyrinomonadaceae bacterium]